MDVKLSNKAQNISSSGELETTGLGYTTAKMYIYSTLLVHDPLKPLLRHKAALSVTLTLTQTQTLFIF